MSIFDFTSTIKFRFALLAGVLLAVVVGGGILSYQATQRTAKLFATYTDTNTPRLIALTELDTRVAHMQSNSILLATQSSSTPYLLDQMLVELGRIEQTYRSYRAFGATNDQFTALLTDKESYVYALLALQEDYANESTSTREAAYADAASAHVLLTNRVRQAFVAETEAQRIAAQVLSRDVTTNTRTQMLLVTSTLSALLVSILLAYALVLRPLTALRATAFAIARGEEGREAGVVRNDELGDVSRAFNIMVQRMRSAQNATEEHAQKLDSTLKELAQITKTTTDERALFEQLLVAIADAVVVFDASRHAVFANEHARRIMGDGIIGTTTDMICLAHREGDKTHTCFDLVDEAFSYKEPKVIEREFVIVDTRKVRIPISLTLAPVRDEQGVAHHLVLTFRDVTELVRLEEARVSFLSAASHQLRTPLSSMRWFSEMFLDGSLGKLTPKQRDAMGKFSTSTLRMVDLVNSLLQLSRVEARRVEIKPEPIDMIVLSQEIAASLAPDAAQKNQTIVITSKLKKAVVAADRELARQAIMNLVTNALRYGNPKTEIVISVRGTKTAFEISVTNEGIGIPDSDRGRIFEKFYRASNAQKLVPNGNGIGLSLVKFLVEDWGGEIGFESIPNKTTTFHFTIPKKGMVARKGEVSLAV